MIIWLSMNQNIRESKISCSQRKYGNTTYPNTWGIKKGDQI